MDTSLTPSRQRHCLKDGLKLGRNLHLLSRAGVKIRYDRACLVLVCPTKLPWQIAIHAAKEVLAFQCWPPSVDGPFRLVPTHQELIGLAIPEHIYFHQHRSYNNRVNAVRTN